MDYGIVTGHYHQKVLVENPRFNPVAPIAKSSLLIAALVILTVLTVLPNPADAEDEEFITVGAFTYELESHEATLIEYDDTLGSEISVPSHFEYDGITYDITGIDFTAFESTEATSLHIPSTVKMIIHPEYMSLSFFEIMVDKDNDHLRSIDGVLYSKDGAEIIKYPAAKEGIEYHIPNAVTIIGQGAFAGCNLESVWIGEKMRIIGSYAFMECKRLSNINSDSGINSLPSNVMMIGVLAFESCISLESLLLPESLTVISSLAFYHSGLKTISIGPYVELIGYGAFAECSELESIEVEIGNERYATEDGVLYAVSSVSSAEATILLAYPAGSPRTTFKIPSEITDIEAMAFQGCVNLKTVIMSDSMRTVDAYSFNYCPSLEKVVLSNSILSIGSMAFAYCTSLKEIKWGNNLEVIEEMAFYHSGIASLKLPKSLEEIEDYAFAECMNMTEITFPENMTHIGNYIFIESFNLQYIDFNCIYAEIEPYALEIGTEEKPASVLAHAVRGFDVPTPLYHEYTEIEWDIDGERPYPYENFIGVAICVLVLLGIIRLFREV